MAVDWASLMVPALSGLVGAGVGGLITFRVARLESDAARGLQQSAWAREDRERRLSDYADLVAVASEIMGSWADLLTPRPVEEIAAMDSARQTLYARLHKLIAMTRITAPSAILVHAEDMMFGIRRAQTFIRAYAVGGKTGVTGGVANAAWQEIDKAFSEARGAFAESIRATLGVGPSLPGIGPAAG